MAGKKKLPTRSLGTENVETPPEAVAAWAAARKGRGGDLTTFRLETALCDQGPIDQPCSGGTFYGDRWLKSIRGVEGNTLVGEPSPSDEDIAQDARAIIAIRRNAWASVPSCSSLGIMDRYYRDRDEFIPAIAGVYRDLARTMRDHGIQGHVYLGTAFSESELETLAGPRGIFFDETADKKALTRLLEHQTTLVMDTRTVPVLEWLLGMYDIDELILLDPLPEILIKVMEVMDPTKIVAGGYCRAACRSYWDILAEQAVIPPTLQR